MHFRSSCFRWPACCNTRSQLIRRDMEKDVCQRIRPWKFTKIEHINGRPGATHSANSISDTASLSTSYLYTHSDIPSPRRRLVGRCTARSPDRCLAAGYGICPKHSTDCQGRPGCKAGKSRQSECHRYNNIVLRLRGWHG
jgi:hypothetical protein